MKLAKENISTSLRSGNLYPIVIALLMSLTILVFFCTIASAEYYKWTDEKGQLHITDDKALIPEAYMDKFKTVSPAPALSIPASELPRTSTTPRARPGKVAEKLYGDHPVNWWKNRIDLKKIRISEVEKSIEQKQTYIDLYRGGRRYGKVYSEEQQEMNKSYKKEIPELEEKKKLYEEELAELLRKATLSGVPRSIRGE